MEKQAFENCTLQLIRKYNLAHASKADRINFYNKLHDSYVEPRAVILDYSIEKDAYRVYDIMTGEYSIASGMDIRLEAVRGHINIVNAIRQCKQRTTEESFTRHLYSDIDDLDLIQLCEYYEVADYNELYSIVKNRQLGDFVNSSQKNICVIGNDSIGYYRLLRMYNNMIALEDWAGRCKEVKIPPVDYIKGECFNFNRTVETVIVDSSIKCNSILMGTVFSNIKNINIDTKNITELITNLQNSYTYDREKLIKECLCDRNIVINILGHQYTSGQLVDIISKNTDNIDICKALQLEYEQSCDKVDRLNKKHNFLTEIDALGTNVQYGVCLETGALTGVRFTRRKHEEYEYKEDFETRIPNAEYIANTVDILQCLNYKSNSTYYAMYDSNIDISIGKCKNKTYQFSKSVTDTILSSLRVYDKTFLMEMFSNVDCYKQYEVGRSLKVRLDYTLIPIAVLDILDVDTTIISSENHDKRLISPIGKNKLKLILENGCNVKFIQPYYEDFSQRNKEVTTGSYVYDSTLQKQTLTEALMILSIMDQAVLRYNTIIEDRNTGRTGAICRLNHIQNTKAPKIKIIATKVQSQAFFDKIDNSGQVKEFEKRARPNLTSNNKAYRNYAIYLTKLLTCTDNNARTLFSTIFLALLIQAESHGAYPFKDDMYKQDINNKTSRYIDEWNNHLNEIISIMYEYVYRYDFVYMIKDENGRTTEVTHYQLINAMAYGKVYCVNAEVYYDGSIRFKDGTRPDVNNFSNKWKPIN